LNPYVSTSEPTGSAGATALLADEMGVAVPRSGDRARAVGALRRAPGLVVLSTLVATVLLLPLAFLLLEARDAGASAVWHLIWRSFTAQLLWNTVRLTVVVTALCAVIGTILAWCVERTDLPARHVWAVLVVIPFAIPDFIVSFAWSSLSTRVEGFQGAVLVMTLAVYPLVYLPVAASLRNADPGLEEIARGLGLGSVATFFRVTVRQVRGAILGGCVLVALVMLAEYGAFEILSYRTFTTEIFTELQAGAFDVAAACALSLVLVALSMIVLFADAAVRRGATSQHSGTRVPRVVPRHRLGRATIPVLSCFGLLVVLALGVPIGSSIYWIFEGGAQDLVGVSILDALWHTALYGSAAGVLATAMALPVALLNVRIGGRASRLLERSTFLVLATPGIVIALGLSFFVVRYVDGFGYQTAWLLVLAYAILFFPLALVGVSASVAHVPLQLEEVARSLGLTRMAALRRVTLPIIAPGLGAAFCVVFLASVTELTATLLLIPDGVQTLATQFWSYEGNLSYGQAAPFALVIIALAVIPSYVLARYFDRLPSRATRIAQ
jgi:iron(III) transport system permease protein